MANVTAVSRPHNWRVLLVLLALTMTVRGGLLVAKRNALTADTDSYRMLAANVAECGIYGYEVTDPATGQVSVRPTAFRPPIYPLLLACVGEGTETGLYGVMILHWVLGVATVALVYLLSQQWRLGGWGVLAAAFVAFDPILLNQSTLVMTETLATFLAVVALMSLSRLSDKPSVGSAAVVGGVLALASLCRPTFLPWLALAAVILVLASGIRQSRWKLGIALLLGAAAVLSPWIVRNYVVIGRPIIATTHGGYTLRLGNNEGFYEFLRTSDWGDVWDSRELDEQYNHIKEQFGHDEVQADRWAYRRALSCIRNDTGMFAYACTVRVGRLWGLMPHQIEHSESTVTCLMRCAVGLWYISVFALGVIGMCSLGKRLWRLPWVWGVLLCLAFTAMHAVYWSNLRMRAPLMPVVCMAAAAGAKWLTRKRLES